MLTEHIYLLFLNNLDDFVIFEFSLVTIAIVAVVFGIVWLIVNLYHLYPYVQYYLVPRILPWVERRSVYVDPGDVGEGTDSLPTIDILLPAYREGNVIHQSIGSIRRANYPQSLININVLIEPDDDDTRAALDDLRDEYRFREITIPAEYQEIVVPAKYPGLPNKPRALNYGFEYTNGDIVGVIDAEDIVDPDLFKHVYGGLVLEDRDYLQGILDMVNEGDGWMNLIFRAEYAWWFRWLLPAFHATGYPVPLGGTTNFFKRSVLMEISDKRIQEYGRPWDPAVEEPGIDLDGLFPWDPRNVTEDFELGLFLWKEGYDLGLIDSVTREESPISLNEWIRQRTRWQKGKIYSFIQYSYHRPKGIRNKFHLLLQSFLPHLAPINISGIVILALVANILGYGMPIGAAIVLVLGLVFLLELNVLHAYTYWTVSDASLPRRIGRTLVVLVTLPVYWIPLWGAELRALKQTYLGQFEWEKTTHHGRNVEAVAGAHPPEEPPYTQEEVLRGFAVLLFGLLLTVGVPIAYFWL